MAFPMMPTAQWDVVRKMGPEELNRAAMGEYQAQGISPVFALARIKEETALAAAFQAQQQKQQQEEEAKMQGVPVEDIPFTVAEGILRERGITGVDSSAGRDMSPDKMAALQSGIAGDVVEERPMVLEEPPSMMAYGGGLIPRMAYGGLISGYHEGHLVGEPGHGVGPGQHLAEFSPYVGDDAPVDLVGGMPDEAVGGAVYATDEELVRERILRESKMTQRERAYARGPEARAAYDALHGPEEGVFIPSMEGSYLQGGSEEERAEGRERMRRERDVTLASDMDARAAMAGLSPEVYARRTGSLAYPQQAPDSTDTQQAPDSTDIQVPDGQVSAPTTTDEEIMEAAGVTVSPVRSRVQGMLDEVDALAQSAGTYSPAEQDIHVEELRIKRQAIADLDRLEDMRQDGIVDQIAYEDAKDQVRRQVENTTNLRFDEIEEEQRAVRRLGATQISDIGITQAARRGMSDEQIARLTSDQADRLGISKRYIAQVRRDQADRRAASTKQQGILGDIFGRRTILSNEQLAGHRALAADQEKAIRAQANRFADSTLFTGVGDVLRGPPRDQRFGDVVSAVGEIRGGELEDLMGVQTDLLEKTTKIQDELIAEERSVFEEIYNVGERTQTGQEAATAAIGVSREGVQRGQERVTAGIGVLEEGVQGALERGQTEKHNIQNRVLDSQLTSNAEIYTMSQGLLNSKFLALEERRVLQAAINQGDIEAQRKILAAHADFAKHENVIRAQVERMDEDALREKLAITVPATIDLAQMAAAERTSRASSAAQERITRENLLADPQSWQALEAGQNHRLLDIQKQDYRKDAEGNVVRSPEAAAEIKRNAVAGLQQQYSHLLRQQWGFLQRQGDALAGQEDPEVVQTVITRLVASGMPENIRAAEEASVWISEQQVGLKGQMQRRSVENAAGLAEVLRRGRGRPPGWARTGVNSILYESLLEHDPDFADPSSVLYGESQPMTGIRSIPKGSAGEGYGDTPLVERIRRAAPPVDRLEALNERLRDRQSPTSPFGG